MKKHIFLILIFMKNIIVIFIPEEVLLYKHNFLEKYRVNAPKEALYSYIFQNNTIFQLFKEHN